jgi:hypothetical protein
MEFGTIGKNGSWRLRRCTDWTRCGCESMRKLAGTCACFFHWKVNLRQQTTEGGGLTRKHLGDWVRWGEGEGGGEGGAGGQKKKKHVNEPAAASCVGAIQPRLADQLKEVCFGNFWGALHRALLRPSNPQRPRSATHAQAPLKRRAVNNGSSKSAHSEWETFTSFYWLENWPM